MARADQHITLTVIYRKNEFRLRASIYSTLGELGQELRRLTGVAPQTMRLLALQNRRTFSSSLLPFSDEHAAIILQESGLTEDTVLRMMGSLPEELKEVVGVKEDGSIIGFSEEERRAKQRSAPSNMARWNPPQGRYTFSQFQPLELPGIELDPAPDKALEIMHKLASDPGIVSIMNKHQWSVGVMTEMAPLGYVGISPKCVLGFNKNQGEEISLRLRTDDLKGFRKYDSIKKTLLHELAHMVYSEHDADFFALDRQLNEESVAIDWTKAKGQKWGTLKHYEDNHSDSSRVVLSNSSKNGYKVGGSADMLTPNARAAAAAAALRRLGNVSTKQEEDGRNMDVFSNSPGLLNQSNPVAGVVDITGEQPQNDLAVAKTCEKEADCKALIRDNGCEKLSMNVHRNEFWGYEGNILDRVHIVEDLVAPDHDDPLKSLCHRDIDMGTGFVNNDTLESDTLSNVVVFTSNPKRNEDGQDVPLTTNVNKESSKDKPDPDETIDEALVLDIPSALQSNDYEEAASKDKKTSSVTHDVEDFQCSGDFDLSVIQEPGEIVCRRLQQAITKLKDEASPYEVSQTLHTLCIILRNVIEHPQEAKFKRLRKANPLFQSRIAKFKGALEVLHTVGFSEQPSGVDGDDCLILERNDPGLLWLARSSLEICMA